MDVTINNLIKQAKLEASLDKTNKSKNNYIRLLYSLEPYGYGIEELKKLNMYKINEDTFDELNRYYDFIFYTVEIMPTYMYRVNSYFIWILVKTSVNLSSTNNILCSFYVDSTNSDIIFEKIKSNRLTKTDFKEMVKVIENFLKNKYPRIILKYSIEGEDNSYIFSKIDDIDNLSFEDYHSVLNGDT